jgi:uncharacterized heparinase superfamily protein
MPGKHRTLKHYLPIINHRILRPWLWRTFVEQGASSMSDDEFLKLLNFRGTTEAFLQHFHSSSRYNFFFHPRNQKDFFLQLLTSTQSSEDILAEAENVLQNKFSTLGSGLVDLGWPIHWHRDFKSGREWPLKRLSTVEILDLEHSSDIKVPWELSRFHHVWWLGKAYWLTHNEQYAQKFGALVEDWIQNNPLGKGPNWANAMEVAIRSCNWIAGYYLFCESPSLPPKFWISFLKQLLNHGRFIEHHFEIGWRNGNHYLSNLVGLLFLGALFHSTVVGKRWLRLGKEQLERELVKQVTPDGVNYEKSTSYHRLVLELFASAAVLCRRHRVPFSDQSMRHVERMFDFTLHYTRPDGSAPLWGDADDGRLFRFVMNDDVNDHRHMLSVGSVLFARHDFKAAAGSFAQDCLWLFGGEGFEHYQLLRGEPEPPRSKGFTDGGVYIMRSDNAHLFIDAGDLGMNGLGGHGHNDTFSFELWIDGSSLIVDSGTYSYTFDPAARQEFRSTRSHNTVMIDGEELAEFAHLWSVKEDRTNPHILDWTISEQKDRLEAAHFAYAHRSVLHRRLFEFDKRSFRLVITDTLSGTGEHLAESFLHFAPGVELERQESQTVLAKRNDRHFLITAHGGELSLLSTRFSKSYGLIEPKQTICLTTTTGFPTTLRFEIDYA